MIRKGDVLTIEVVVDFDVAVGLKSVLTHEPIGCGHIVISTEAIKNHQKTLQKDDLVFTLNSHQVGGIVLCVHTDWAFVSWPGTNPQAHPILDLVRIDEDTKAAPDLHSFTKSDWYGLAGAERFRNGEEPLIGNIGESQLSIDANGAELWWCDSKDNDINSQWAVTCPQLDSQEHARTVFRDLIADFLKGTPAQMLAIRYEMKGAYSFPVL